MKKLILLSIVLLSLLVAPLSEVFAQARLINYQGNILNEKDLPYEGPVQITFELYSSEFGGSQLWSEIQNVTLNKGYFNVYLGSVAPFPAKFNFNRDMWLQVTVGKGSPYQRTRLSMVPYSGYSDRSAVAGFAEDIADGSVTLAKLADEVKKAGGDLTGFYPNPKIRAGAILENIPDGSITQEKLGPNVTTRPSGPASGDLTGFYPDPLIAAGAVKTDRIADGAVTNEKLADFTIKYAKLQKAAGPAGTILGWNGTAWIETNVPAWEKGRVKSVVGTDGNYSTDATDAEGFITTSVGIAANGVTTPKIANTAVTYPKLQNAAGPAGTILGWDGTKWIETNVPTWETDAVIGNEVLNATPNRGLVRAGAGTLASPYTLGIVDDGVVNSMIINQAVTLNKLANATTNGQVMYWNTLTNSWRLSGGAAPADNQVLRFVNDGFGTSQPVWSSDDAIVGNEITNVVAGGGLQRLGAGTTADPYTVGIAANGVVNPMIMNQAVSYNKLQNAVGPIGTILSWNGTNWIENMVPALEADGVIGNELLDATVAGGLVRAGAGTTANPYTIGISPLGIVDGMIAWHTITYDKMVQAAGPAGTIIGWNGTEWIETNVPAWEKGRVKAVTAGAGTTVANTTDAEGFISTAVGIADGGVTNNMLANGSVSLNKLAAGTQIGQIMWWDQAANQWRFSTGAAPAQDQVIKWIDAGGSLTPRWAPDDMTIPYAKTITENVKPLFSLTNNGNSDLVNLTTTGKGDGIEITVPDDLNGGGHALHVNGGGLNQPALMVNRASEFGLPNGAATINATVNTLDANTAGLEVNTTINDDGNNAYEVDGMRSLLTVNNGVNDVLYTGVWGVSTATNGLATGVWGDADGFNAQSNVGAAGEASNAGLNNIGVLGSANADGAAYVNSLGGVSVGLLGLNTGGTFLDYGVYTETTGNGVGVFADAQNAAAVVGLNNSDADPSVWAFNLADGPAFMASSANTDDYTAQIQNSGAGRGLAITGGKANNENGGLPFVLDPLDNDDAALVVYNPNAASLGGGAAFATAIKTYGDIWANSTIGASQIIGLSKIIVGNPFTGPSMEILPPAFPGAPMVINGPLTVNGNLVATNGNFSGTLNAAGNTTLGGTLAVAGATTINNTFNVTGLTTLAGLNAGASTLNSLAVTNNATVGGNLTVNGLFSAGATTLASLTVTPGATSLQALTAGATTLNSLGVTNNATVGGTFGVTGATTLAGLTAGATTLNSLGVTNNATVGGTLGVTGATTIGGATQINNNLGVTGNAIIGGTLSAGNTTLANLVVNGTSNLVGAATLGNTLTVAGATQVNNTLGVTGATTLGNTLTVAGATQVNNTLGVTGATTLGNNLSVAGNSTLTGNATVGGTLGVTGATTLGNTLTVAGATQVNNTLGVTGATTLGNTLAVAGNANFNGANVTTGAATALNLGNVLFTNGSVGVANNSFLVSRGAGLSPTWTNQINQLTVNGLLTANDLAVVNNATIGGDLTVNGNDVFLNADVTLVGNFDQTGFLTTDDLLVLNTSTLLGDVDITANTFEITVPLTDVLGNVKVTGNTNLVGTLTASGVTNLNNALNVAGATILNTTLQVNGTSDLRGTIFNTVPGGAGDIVIIDNTNITGNLTVTGGPGQGLISGKDLQIQQNATVNQNLTVNQNATFNQNATISQNLTVGGHTSITTLDVTGNIVNPTLGQPVKFVDDVDITGNLNVSGAISVVDLTVSNNLNVGNNVVLNTNAGLQNTTVDNLTANGAATVAGTLGVTGATTLGSTLGVAGATTIGGATQVNNTLTVGAFATTLGGTLGVTGATTLGNTLGVTGATTLGGATQVNNTLTVGAFATTLGGTLGVTGATTLGGATQINNTLGVTGLSTLAGVNSGNTQITGTLGVTGLSTLAALQATTGTFSGAVSAASLTTTNNITAGGTFIGQLANNLTNGAGIAAFTYNNTAAATVAIANDAVTSAMIQDLTIVDADVNAAAAIAGTKINPNFGAQNVLTTGSISGNSIVSTTSVNAGTTITAGTGITSTAGNITATAGDFSAPAGVITTGNAAGTNQFAGDFNVGGTSTFIGTVTANDNVFVDLDVRVTQQMVTKPILTNSADWGSVNLGQRVSFVRWNGAAVTVVAVLPPASAGAILYIHNEGAAMLTFNGQNINVNETFAFINTDGNSANWKRIQ
jgi:hypothetical protein